MPEIRLFKITDAPALRALKFTTIRQVNRKDYNEQQLQAWAPDEYDEAEWLARISEINPLVATLGDFIVGFADVQDDGYIDHFLCRSDYQGQGIGKARMNEILAISQLKSVKRLYSHVSITAGPFFEHNEFRVVRKQQVEIRGEVLINFVMERLVADRGEGNVGKN